MVPSISCSDIRKWLLKCHASHLNKHISFINRIITHALGNEVIPPQFNAFEENQIIDYWNRISHEYQINYNEMKQKIANKNKTRSNNPYYPLCILFIVEEIFIGDPRVKQLNAMKAKTYGSIMNEKQITNANMKKLIDFLKFMLEDRGFAFVQIKRDGRNAKRSIWELQNILK